MIEISNYLSTTKSRILLQVHDEIICEIHNSDLDTVPEQIKNLMETNSLKIPLFIDMEMCDPSWATKRDFNVELTESVKNDIIEYIDWD